MTFKTDQNENERVFSGVTPEMLSFLNAASNNVMIINIRVPFGKTSKTKNNDLNANKIEKKMIGTIYIFILYSCYRLIIVV